MASQSDLATELLSHARDDEMAARELLKSDAISDAIVGFHCQQAIEKALKAMLAMSAVDFPFTHDLGALIVLCERAGTPVPAELEDVDRLTPYVPGCATAGRIRAPSIAVPRNDGPRLPSHGQRRRWSLEATDPRADTKRTHQIDSRDHARSSLSASNNFIWSGFVSSRDSACPRVPRSGLMKEILGRRLMG
jgi:hypothetical protein